MLSFLWPCPSPVAFFSTWNNLVQMKKPQPSVTILSYLQKPSESNLVGILWRRYWDDDLKPDEVKRTKKSSCINLHSNSVTTGSCDTVIIGSVSLVIVMQYNREAKAGSQIMSLLCSDIAVRSTRLSEGYGPEGTERERHGLYIWAGILTGIRQQITKRLVTS